MVTALRQDAGMWATAVAGAGSPPPIGVGFRQKALTRAQRIPSGGHTLCSSITHQAGNATCHAKLTGHAHLSGAGDASARSFSRGHQLISGKTNETVRYL